MKLSQRIEHTLLDVQATKEDIKRICEEAVANDFRAVCVAPFYVSLAKDLLKKTQVKVVTVVGFPFGYNMVSSKSQEAKKALDDGADELDMVMNIAAFKSQQLSVVQDDIERVATLCRLRTKKIKVIIETGLLTYEEKTQICSICKKADVDFVKTSTGFNGQGATVEDVQLLRSLLPESIKVKASGGIKTRQSADALVLAGAETLGTSSGIQIVNDPVFQQLY